MNLSEDLNNRKLKKVTDYIRPNRFIDDKTKSDILDLIKEVRETTTESNSEQKKIVKDSIQNYKEIAELSKRIA